MATDNRNSGSSSPPFNPYNPYNSEFPRARYDKYGTENNSGTGKTDTTLPPYNSEFPRARYDKYGTENNSGTGKTDTTLPPYISEFPRARYDKYGTENNSGTGNIAMITPAVVGVPRNQTYGMPPPDTTVPPHYNPYNSQFPRAQYYKYGTGNNSGMGDIAVITPPSMGIPKNQTYGMPPPDTIVPPPNNPYNSQFPRAQYYKYGTENNSGTGDIAVITPPSMGIPKNQTYGMPPPDTVVPPPNNPYNSQFPRAQYYKYGTENNSGTGDIAVITPPSMGISKNQTYGMPPPDTIVPPPNNPYNSQFPRAQYYKYGTENNSGTGDIAVITPGSMGIPKNQTYGMPPPDTIVPLPNNPYNSQFPRAQYYKYGTENNSGTGDIAVITPAVMGVPETQTYGMPPPDYAEGLEEMNRFSDASIRRGFVRKVYLTLMIQLLITTGIICAFLYWEALKKWTSDNYTFTIAMMPTTIVLIFLISCCGNLRRKVPLNFIFLGLITIAEGLMLGSITVFLKTEIVLWAMGATAFVTLSVILFTVQSKWELTKCSGVMWALCWSLISFGLLCAIFRSQYGNIGLACLGTTFFSMYLILDTQFMLGGRHGIDPEEYILAALSLYMDLLIVFLFVLRAFGDSG